VKQTWQETKSSSSSSLISITSTLFSDMFPAVTNKVENKMTELVGNLFKKVGFYNLSRLTSWRVIY
jgi:hypothetical protein